MEPCDFLPLDEQPLLDTDENWILLKLSEAGFTRLYSAIRLGAEIFDPEKSYEIELDFLQGVMCMQLCDVIASQCLTEPGFVTTLIDTLLPYGVGSNGSGSDVQITSINASDISALGGSCTDAEAYGNCYAIVGQLHTISTDFLEGIETLTNDLEKAEALISAVPIFGNFISSALAWIDKYISDIEENYAAAFNVNTHEDIACTLFCSVMGTCEITVEDVRNAYRQYLDGFLPPALGVGLDEWVDWFVTLTLATDDIIVAAMHLSIMEIMVRGSRWLGSTFRSLEIATALALPVNPPASCVCSDEWCYIFDLTTSNGSFVANVPNRNDQGEWISGTGWSCEWGTFSPPNGFGNDARCYIRRTGITATSFNVIDVKYTSFNGGGSRGLTVSLYYLGGSVFSDTVVWTENVTDQIYQVTPNGITADEIRVTVTSNLGSNPSPDFFHMTEFVMNGEGSNPFGVDNC